MVSAMLNESRIKTSLGISAIFSNADLSKVSNLISASKSNAFFLTWNPGIVLSKF